VPGTDEERGEAFVGIRALTAGAVITTVTAAAVIAAGVAGGAPGVGATMSVTSSANSLAAMSVPSVHAPGMRIHVVNLHQQFARALARQRAGSAREAGVVPMMTGRGTRAGASAPATATLDAAVVSGVVAAATPKGCREPDCDVSRHGGAVQHSPHVYLLLWGPAWTSVNGNGSAVANYLASFYSGLGQTSRDSWSTITSQYSDGTGSPAFTAPVLVPGAGVFNDMSTPPNPVTPDDIASEALGLISTAGITDPADAQVVVASQAGTCFSDGFAGNGGNCAFPPTATSYCGWHSAARVSPGSSVYLPYVNLPWQLDAGYSCGANFVNGGSSGILDGWSLVGGHEYAETVSDPDPNTGYIDLSDVTGNAASGGEIGDKCVWGGVPFGVNDPYGDITLSTGTFAMQSLWSNAARRCVMTTNAELYVATPAAQKSVLGKPASLQLTAVTNTGVQAYAATGLPPGLSINTSTGRITGKPSVTAGTFRPRVRIWDYAKTVTISFTWFVSSGVGAVRGYGAKCADDADGRISSGNKIDIWSCTGKTPQRITFLANRELQVAGRCVTGGTTAFLEPCEDMSDQVWTRRANGEYVLAATGKCLTDPADSKANGTRLALAVCRNAANQHWSLP
jgi:3D (Asp-Asp-Asp) domain-containing protein